MTRFPTRRTLARTVFAALGFLASSAQAQTYQLATLVKFDGATMGASPLAGVTLSGTTLYGTTSTGGTGGGGTVFSLPTAGGTPQIRASFNSGDSTNSPKGALLLSGTTLYGTTFGSNTNDTGLPTQGGTVFSISTSGTLKTLTTFNNDGSNPAAGLALSGTTLYGTTQFGGTNDAGTVFSISTAAVNGTPSTLASFVGTADGTHPEAGVTLSGTTLYGTTFFGGTNSVGTLYSLPITGGTPTPLVNFTDTAGTVAAPGIGANPLGGLTLIGTTLYGTTSDGGVNGDGTLFSYNITTRATAALVTFTGTANGANPGANLTLSGTTLFGTTQNGGTNGAGTVFSFNTATNTNPFSTLVSFPGGVNSGAYPVSSLTVGANGVLYGTTSGGGVGFDAANGITGDGTVFSLTPVAAPEPSPFVVISLGIFGLGVLTLRAKKRTA